MCIRDSLSTMNLGFGRNDLPENVVKNHEIIANAIGFNPENIVASKQTHTTNVKIVSKKDCGKGIYRERDYEMCIRDRLPDKPGELVKVANEIAKQQGNVIKLEHNQFVSVNRNAAVELKVTLECFGHDHKEQILKALKKTGYNPKEEAPNL